MTKHMMRASTAVVMVGLLSVLFGCTDFGPVNMAALSVEIDCPDEDVVVGSDVELSTTANHSSATVNLETSVGGVLTDLGDGQVSISADAPAEVTVTATATDGTETARATCTIRFIEESSPTDTPSADSTGNGSDAIELIPSSSVQRAPFRSACAQLVVACTSSWPHAVMSVAAGPGQTVIETSDPPGFIINGSDGDGIEAIMLVGSGSDPGNADACIPDDPDATKPPAEELFFSWSYGATEEDPCLLTPGTEFSTEADVTVTLEEGIHYIRMALHNEQIHDVQTSGVAACGMIPSDFKSDFVELVIEVRDESAAANGSIRMAGDGIDGIGEGR